VLHALLGIFIAPRLFFFKLKSLRVNLPLININSTISIKVPTEELVVTGWGRRNNDPSDRGSLSTTGAYSNILQQLILPEVPIEKCKEIAAFEDLDVQKQICAGGEAGEG
jgi:hypothetical protein